VSESQDVSALESPLVELLLRYFGDAAAPNYSATLQTALRDPYRGIRDERLGSGSWFFVAGVRMESGLRARRGGGGSCRSLPTPGASVEEAGVVDDDALEEPVELVIVDAVGSLHLPVQAGRAGLDVDVLDAAVEKVPMEAVLELGSVVGLHEFGSAPSLVDGKMSARLGADPSAWTGSLDRTWSMNWMAVFWLFRS
jgi:hypothetical protein